jgi:hypothetical protein
MVKNVHTPQISTFIKNVLREAKKDCGLTWKEISCSLLNLGIEQSERDLISKYSKGEMQAELFVSLLIVMSVSEVTITKL